MRTPPFRAAALAALALVATACGSSGGSSSSVTVTPATAALAPGATQAFSATSTSGAASFTWSVAESGGGTVTAAGLYTAPARSGTYHVVATSTADPSQSGQATVTVSPAPACTPNVPQPSALPAAQVISLGVHTVGEVVTFTVPPGTGGLSILQQGAEPLQAMTYTYQGATDDNTVVPLTVKVNGTTFYDDGYWPCAAGTTCDPSTWGGPNGLGSIYYAGASAWTGTMTVPNTSQALSYVAQNGGVPAGTWAVTVNDRVTECRGTPQCVVGSPGVTYPDARYDLKVLLRPGTVGATGTMDVRFYLVTDQITLAQAQAPGSPSQRMADTFRSVMAAAGITVGTLDFADAPAAVKARYASGVNADSSLPCTDIAAILSLAGPGNRMNLFLVNSLVSSQGPAGTTVVGVDGTIPGPSSVGGTLASGALVSAANLTSGCSGAVNFRTCGPDKTAYIAAHETGHFLGLYHVTESTGTLFDPVSDTATCACSTCRPASAPLQCYGNGVSISNAYAMTGANCTASTGCGGGDNLMFWVLSTASTGVLSAQQASILRANALVQ
jgi:hypothetical protein